MNPINRIGQKVVCNVDRSLWLLYGCGNVLKMAPNKGDVFTVSGFETWRGIPCIHLRELANMECTCLKYSSPWPIAAFRPVDERTTDISAFTEILNTTKAPERIDA